MVKKTNKWGSALWALVATLGTQLPAAQSAESNTVAAPVAPVAPVAGGTLPLTCQAAGIKGSSVIMRIQLTDDAFKRVVFDHPQHEGTMPAGVIGQSMVCTCVDAAGTINDGVKLLRGSGSPQLDAEAVEISKNLEYPAGHPGCMHQTINFTAP
jgi:outer membrane biosynthesis protein TonB